MSEPMQELWDEIVRAIHAEQICQWLVDHPLAIAVGYVVAVFAFTLAMLWTMALL